MAKLHLIENHEIDRISCTEPHESRLENPQQNSIKSSYHESSIIPLTFEPLTHQILLLHNILNRKYNELVETITWEQNKHQCKGDFYAEVKEKRDELDKLPENLIESK